MHNDHAGCGWCGKVMMIIHATYVHRGTPFCNRQHMNNWAKREDARVQARREIHDRLRNVPLGSWETMNAAAG